VINFVWINILRNNLHSHSNGGKVKSLSASASRAIFSMMRLFFLKITLQFSGSSAFKSYSLCNFYGLTVTLQVLHKILKTENKHTLNQFSVCSKTKKLPLVYLSPTQSAFFHCSLLRGQGTKYECLVRAALKYQYDKISPFHFALPSPIFCARPKTRISRDRRKEATGMRLRPVS
jgi:hypothetical protein